MATYWPLTIAVSQFNPTVGCCLPNALTLAKRCEEARERGADVVVTPLMALCGHPLGALTRYEGFHQQAEQALQQFTYLVPPELPVVLGHGCLLGGRFVECIYLVHHGQATPVTYRIPTSSQGTSATSNAVIINKRTIGICFADLLPADPQEMDLDLLVVCDASPYDPKMPYNRYSKISNLVRTANRSVIYVNLVGGQDEWLFDGRSFALNECGDVQAQLPPFSDCMGYLSLANRQITGLKTGCVVQPDSDGPWPVEECYQALVFGLKEFARKNGFNEILVGLSGGIDSALTLTLAVDAVGAEHVHALMMPSKYTADISIEDAKQLTQSLGVTYEEISIQPLFDAFLEALQPIFGPFDHGTTEQNLQARIRGTLLMAMSNRFHPLVLATSNKSEVAVGYTTLYGDSIGGFAPLKDVYKTQVYALARYRNSISQVIPERILERPPSAELKPDQTDQDDLPPYEVLDAILESYFGKHESIDKLVEQGFNRSTVERVAELLLKSEFKRKQSPIGIRISKSYFFGELPITHLFCDSSR